MSRRIIQTLATGLGLSGCCWVYALIMTPLLAPPPSTARMPRADTDIVVGAGSAMNVEMARQYLAQSATWATEAKLQYHSSGAYLYANEFEHHAGDADHPTGADIVRFAPFALIWFPKGEESGQRPICMVAESARIQFSGHFAPAAPEPGHPIGGALERRVEIDGPDGLHIVGRNFIFEKAAMHVRSDNPIDFAYQGHYGNATGGIQIDLLPAADAEDDDGLSLGGIHSVKLRRHVEMHLKLEEGDHPTDVTVHSSDGFQYVLQTNIAIFKGTVAVDRPTSPVEMDSLRCDLLSLIFDSPRNTSDDADSDADSTEPPDEANESFALMDNQLEFVRLQAEGKNVLAASQSNKLSARMVELIYDARRRVVAMKDDRSVALRYGASELHSPEITFTLDTRDQIAEAWCRGAGNLEYRDPKTTHTQVIAQWQHELHKYHDTTSGLDAFSLSGNALVRHPDASMGIGAELITFWVDELGRAAAAAQDDQSNAEEDATPRRLRAERKVEVMSPELIGRTELLDVWFEPLAAAAATDPAGVERIGQRGQQTALPGVVHADSTSDSNSRQPVDVSADWIRVRVVGVDQPDHANVDTVWADGNVSVRQQDMRQKTDLQLLGQKLRLTNQGEFDQKLIVFGDLAQVHNSDSWLEGKEIHFDRLANRVEVIGDGKIRFMVTQDFEGNPLDQPRPLTVQWQDQMTFDGHSGVFLGQVTATLSDSWMTCEEMTVELNRQLSFTESDPRTQDLELHNLICKNGVRFESRDYEQGELVAIRKGKFWDFRLNQASGEVKAEGPGFGMLWRRKKNEGTVLSPDAVVQANRAPHPDAKKWEYLRIDFAGRMTGHTQHRYSTFHDDIFIVYGPVSRPLDQIDPDALAKGSGWLRCEQLELTQHRDMESESNYLTMTATGNVDMDGESFHARADEVTYDDLKKLFVLRAIGSQAATIWHEQTHGNQSNGGSAQRIEFSPSHNTLKLYNTTGLGLQ